MTKKSRYVTWSPRDLNCPLFGVGRSITSSIKSITTLKPVTTLKPISGLYKINTGFESITTRLASIGKIRTGFESITTRISPVTIGISPIKPVTYPDIQSLMDEINCDYRNTFGSGQVDENGNELTEDGTYVFRDEIAIQDEAPVYVEGKTEGAPIEFIIQDGDEKILLARLIKQADLFEDVPAPKPEPPAWAEMIVSVVLPMDRHDAVLGDFDERFAIDCEKFGVERARRRYWANAVNSLLPLAWQALKKLRAIALFEVARRLLGG